MAEVSSELGKISEAQQRQEHTTDITPPIPEPKEQGGYPVRDANGLAAYVDENTGEYLEYPQGFSHPVLREDSPADLVLNIVKKQKAYDANVAKREAVARKKKAKEAAESTAPKRKLSPSVRQSSADQSAASQDAVKNIVDEVVDSAPFVQQAKKQGKPKRHTFEVDIADEVAASTKQETTAEKKGKRGKRGQVPQQPTVQQQDNIPPNNVPPNNGPSNNVPSNNKPSGNVPPRGSGKSGKRGGERRTQRPQTEAERVAADALAKEYLTREWDTRSYKEMMQAKRHNARVQSRRDKIEESGGDLAAFDADPKNAKNPEAFDRYVSAVKDAYENHVVGETLKDQEHLWKQMDSFMKDLRIGFFHLSGERVMYDKETGEPYFMYSKKVQQAINQMCDMFGLSSSWWGRRTVFRMVRIYASMSVDRHGRMFGSDKSDWSMNDDDFVDICKLMMESARTDAINHNPFRMVDPKKKLGGTGIYPPGIIPKVVLKAICNNKSICGADPGVIAEACKQEWNNITHPKMLRDVANAESVEKTKARKARKKQRWETKFDKIFGREREEKEQQGKTYAGARAQLVVIEGVMQALARIDALSAADFAKFGIDTTTRYTLEEYKSATAQYAAALHGNFDADIVAKRDKMKAELWEERLGADRYETTNFSDNSLNDLHVDKKTDIAAGARMAAECVRANAIAGNVAVMVGAAAEGLAATATTDLATRIMLSVYDADGKYSISPAMKEALSTPEMKEAMAAVKLLIDTYGPGAVRMFCRDGHVFTIDEVETYIREKLLPGTTSDRRSTVLEILREFRNLTMSGDLLHSKWDIMNWYRALLINHAARAEVQDELESRGEVDKMGIALTVNEIEDTYRASNDPARWLADVMADDSALSAYLMMRGNSIVGLNPVSFAIQSYFLKHGVAEGAITVFLDNFPQYGLNLLYNFLPFSKTISYVLLKKSSNENVATDADLLIGGNLGRSRKEGESVRQAWHEDPGFWQGLQLNLIYDSVTFGRYWIVTPFILAMVFLAGDWDEPDDKLSLSDPSSWIVFGEEVQKSFWLNDLTLFGLPMAYYFATGIKTGDWDLAGKLMLNSLKEQIDGNVLFDMANVFKNWQVDLVEFAKIADDPDYHSDKLNMSALSLLLYEYTLKVLNKVTPGAPLYRNIRMSSFLRGDDATNPSPYKEWGESDWERENGIAHYIDDPREILERGAALDNPAIALAFDFFRNFLSPTPGTSYWWWGMPPSTMADPVGLGYMSEESPSDYTNGKFLDFDYSNRGVFTEAEYDYLKTQELFAYIDGKGWTDPSDAAADAFFLPNDFRYAVKDVLYSEITFLENDLKARVAAGEIAEGSDAWWDATKKINKRRSDIKGFIADWIDSDTIPAWYPSYEQTLTDWTTRYYDIETKEPKTWFDYWLLGPDKIVKERIPKGNHPNSILPFTFVDKDGKGYNAETLPSWWEEGYSDLDSIKNGVGEQTIELGRFAGKTVNDVIFGGEQPEYPPLSSSDDYTNPDEPTVGIRSYVEKKTTVDEAVKNLKQENASGSVYGDAGKDSSSQKKSSSSNTNTESSQNSASLFGVEKAYADETPSPIADIGIGAVEVGLDNKPKSGQEAGIELLEQMGNGTYFPIETYGFFTDSGGSDFYADIYGEDSESSSGGNWTWLGPGWSGYNSNGTKSSSSYIPKIYSNSRSLNASRPSTMYSKQPRDASYSYLRPSFTTQGSRSAYER